MEEYSEGFLTTIMSGIKGNNLRGGMLACFCNQEVNIDKKSPDTLYDVLG